MMKLIVAFRNFQNASENMNSVAEIIKHWNYIQRLAGTTKYMQNMPYVMQEL